MGKVYSLGNCETVEEEACYWLIKLDGDEPLSDEERQQLNDWIERNPSHSKELLSISAFWNDANILTELSVPLHGKRENDRPTSFGFSSFWQKYNRVTLACFCLLSIMVVMWNGQEEWVSNGLYATAIGDHRVTQLRDGSIVTINTDSQIQVDYSEQERKIRLLRGEAHFDVVHDPDRPFKVFVGEGMVRAIGTSFSVKLTDSEINVLVSEGRVDLASTVTSGRRVQEKHSTVAPEKRPPTREFRKIASLNMGQRATFLNRIIDVQPEGKVNITASLIKEISNLDEKEILRRLSWQKGYLMYEGEPLSQVVDDLNRYIPGTIEIEGAALGQLKIGGRFKVGQLDSVFDILESGFGIQVYHIDDQHIQLRKLQP